ncbi:hypothetical protein FA13DRAFT_1715923 [Coprinellus micaceus]|uniref:Uncharacterized protein n=1 Tax=Coprinellus micaceus TaxID=71717 RepID=A0A4Y7SLH9_COPMI|nr:hypothetical protein FA13DRAFT_1715923 [Coprinellus micaceus]
MFGSIKVQPIAVSPSHPSILSVYYLNLVLQSLLKMGATYLRAFPTLSPSEPQRLACRPCWSTFQPALTLSTSILVLECTSQEDVLEQKLPTQRGPLSQAHSLGPLSMGGPPREAEFEHWPRHLLCSLARCLMALEGIRNNVPAAKTRLLAVSHLSRAASKVMLACPPEAVILQGCGEGAQSKGPPVEQSRYGRLGGRVLLPRSGVQLSQRVGSIGIQFCRALGVVWIED